MRRQSNQKLSALRQIEFCVLTLAKVALVAGGVFFPVAGALAESDARTDTTSALSSKPIPMKTEKELPSRTPPIIEIGPEFLGAGNISPGFELPTGAVWQPALWVFGDYRTALQYYDNGPAKENQEWANRLDLLFNLKLTGTERILYGISPLRTDGRFTGYARKPDGVDGFSQFNARTTTLFFEGDFGQIFPKLDPEDRHSLDIGFAVGRQPLLFQEGILINDTVDALGITRDNIIIPGLTQDMRVTALFGWNNIHRHNNVEDNDARIYGLFTETNLRASTVNVDFAYVTSKVRTTRGGDGAFLGASTIQRIGLINTAFRVNSSYAVDRKNSQISNGTLLFAELSTSPKKTDDAVYLDLFWGINNYTSAARDPTAGGPLGQTGILFASAGLGNYGTALSNSARESYGGAIGYQKFFNGHRTQVVVEIGGRQGTVATQDGAVAIGTRVQQALGDRFVLQFDGFLAKQESRDDAAGFRTEFLTRF